jgi:hypothetical protein
MMKLGAGVDPVIVKCGIFKGVVVDLGCSTRPANDEPNVAVMVWNPGLSRPEIGTFPPDPRYPSIFESQRSCEVCEPADATRFGTWALSYVPPSAGVDTLTPAGGW